MRLFVAALPPVEVVDDLDAFLEPRRDAVAPLRWSPAAQWHLTLAFLPAAPEHVVEELVAGLEAAVARHPAVDVALGGGGCFPDVTRARVLWAGIRGGAALAGVSRAVRSAAARVGAAPDGGELVPHLTLARFPRPVDATRWVRVLDSYAGPPWPIGELTLVESHLPRAAGHRPRHEVVSRMPLRD